MAEDLGQEAIISAADQAAEAAAAAQRNGDSSVSVPAPAGSDESGGALDSLFNELGSAAPDTTGVELGRENNGVQLPIEGAPREQPAAPSAAPASAEPATPAAPAAEPSKSLLDEIASTAAKPIAEPAKPAPASSEADPYASHKLRSDASPKTQETFENLKRTAREREQRAIQEAEKIRTEKEQVAQQFTQLQEQLKAMEQKAITPELENELKELRAFRVQFDVEHSPEFKTKFEQRVEKNYETIYERLKFHGLPESEVAKLKSFGTDDRDRNIESYLEKLPPADRRLIEAKLVDNAEAGQQRSQALQEARQNADKILSEQQQATLKDVERRDTEVAEVVKGVLPRLPWIHTREVAPTATPAERAEAEAANAYAKEMQGYLARALTDDTPARRAEAALAVPLARHLHKLTENLQKENEGLKKELESIRKASATARTARSAATPVAVVKQAAPLSQDSGSALDDLFREVQQQARTP